MDDFTVIDQFMHAIIDEGKIHISTSDHPVCHSISYKSDAVHLIGFACRSNGRALVYLPFMMEATNDGVAILFRKRSLGLGAFRMVPSLLFEAYTWT